MLGVEFFSDEPLDGRVFVLDKPRVEALHCHQSEVKEQNRFLLFDINDSIRFQFRTKMNSKKKFIKKNRRKLFQLYLENPIADILDFTSLAEGRRGGSGGGGGIEGVFS